MSIKWKENEEKKQTDIQLNSYIKTTFETVQKWS